MIQLEPDIARATLFQLQALTNALRHGSFAAAASELGLRDKHRLIKAVERLAENLQLEGLSKRIGDEPVPSIALRELEVPADHVLSALQEFQRAAEALGSRTVVVRCLTYPSMVTIFLARAVGRFEATRSDDVRRWVRFVELESRNRREGGAAMLGALRSRLVDVTVGPTRRSASDNAVGQRVLYSWRLVAPIGASHPAREHLITVGGRQALPIDQIARFPLLLSPTGHESRDLLVDHEPVGGYRVELETSNSQARAALGLGTDRVPIIASDSLTEREFDPTWPAIVVPAETGRAYTYVGSSHSIYWRKDLPSSVQPHIDDFVDVAVDAAVALRQRPGGSPS